MDAPLLTLTERLNLANQYKILAALNEDNADEFTRNAEILLRGHRGFYHYMFDDISEEVPETITEEVMDVLEMFGSIKLLVDELPESEAADLDMSKLTFAGFDANNEKHYAQARFIVDRLDLFNELKGAKFNSHSQLALMRYRRMLPVFKAARESKEGINLKVLKALQVI